MPVAGPVADGGGEQAAGHAAKRIGADVETHRPRPLGGRQFLAKIGHRRRRHAGDADAEPGAGRHQQPEIGGPGGGQRKDGGAGKADAHQPLAPPAVGDQAERDEQQGHHAGAGGHRQAGASRRDAESDRQLWQQRLRAVEQQEAGKSRQRQGQRDAERKGRRQGVSRQGSGGRLNAGRASSAIGIIASEHSIQTKPCTTTFPISGSSPRSPTAAP
ncbi:hypothetical protein SDC9_181835 [bioreactor metagenome]|uniref:Uncharacterized protein n=1 Tax=bioreactor metagenome TaxID=1076179 RepID=A0A645H7K1_9ZZZZ